MANNFRYTGKRLPVASASTGLTSGTLVVQEGIFGVALTTVLIGGSLWLGTEGVWNLPVPVGTVKGNPLYAPGQPATKGAAITLTKAPSGATLVGIAMSDRDSLNNALVLLAAQAAGNAGATGMTGP